MAARTAPPLLWTLLALALCACEERPTPVIDVPFCASEQTGTTPRLAKAYVIIARDHDSRHVSSLGQSFGAPVGLGFFGSNVRAALIECSKRPESTSGEWAEELSADHVPSVCPDQKVVFNQELELVENERSKALGYSGFLRFPQVELECEEGTLVQANDHTLLQILGHFEESVTRYHDKHEKLPPSFDALATETKAEALPADPWGTPLELSTEPAGSAEPTVVRLNSAGPDRNFGSEDDVEVLRQGIDGSRTSSLTFQGVDQSPTANYRAFLERRGVE